MALLSDQDAAFVRSEFEHALNRPVRLVMFTQDHECAFCRETHQICQEVAALSPRLDMQVRDFLADESDVKLFGIDKIPAIVPLEITEGGADFRDFGIRIYGVPSGYEFISLLEAIKLVGSGMPALSKATMDRIAGLKEPLHIQVLVTPT
jgi:alkyl hydroperoxide reductase subunit AhpF